MSKVVYAGASAGLKTSSKGGDMNSPFDYELYCSCGKFLGPMGRFAPNEGGQRSAYCLVCKHVTIVDRSGQIAGCIRLK